MYITLSNDDPLVANLMVYDDARCHATNPLQQQYSYSIGGEINGKELRFPLKWSSERSCFKCYKDTIYSPPQSKKEADQRLAICFIKEEMYAIF